MKLLANGLASLVHAGVVLVAKGDFLEVPEHLVELAKSHGATLIEDVKQGVRVVEKLVEKVVEKVVEVERPDETDPNKDGADSIDTMKRGELCASLKALGVPYKLPIGNDELRKLLRDKIATLHTPPAAAAAAAAPAAAAPQSPPATDPAAAPQQQQPPQP